MGLLNRHKRTTGEMQTMSDEQLVFHYHLHKEPDCIGILYERYTHLVFSVCLKYLENEADAEDLTMNIFEKLLSELKTTRVENFKGWLFTVTRNECLMHLRKQKKNNSENLQKLSSDIMESDEDLHLYSGETVEEKLQHLEQSIEQLNHEQKQCVQLFYLQELTYKDVSEQTGYSMNEVKSHLQNARRMLKIILEKNR